jgi:hypothetical protein
MSNFRTKLLGIAAVATAFAGVSYGQLSNCIPSAVGNSNPTLRAEGETELVGDISVSCTNASATTATLYITTSAPITSKAVTIGGIPSNEITAQVTSAGGAVVQGTVTGTYTAQFTIAIPVATPFVFQVSNVRVNATASAAPQVTESMLISVTVGAGSQNTSIPAQNVGYILQSLATTAFGTGGAATVNYTACVGNPAPSVAASFTLNVKELVSGAFKTLAHEGGSYVAAPVGVANTSTEILISLANVPASATIYMQPTISILQVGTTTLSIPNAVPVAAGPYAGLVGFTPVNGAVSVTYGVTADASVGVTTFPVPVVMAFAANSAVAQTAVTGLVTYAPTGTVTGPAAAVPTFAVSTATPVAGGSAIMSCATTLLFPYVTNDSGYETGIAVTNTTTDNLSVTGKTVSTPVNGTCTLNFYGNGAQPMPVTTLTIGAYTAAAPTVVPVWANTLTSMIGQSGFQGYAIAQCNFLEAHGFAFITDAQGTFSGTMGYLGVVIPNGRGEATGNVGE